MIDRRIEYVLEQLYPRLVDHDLALSELTGAAAHHLAARDIVDRIDLTARTPMPRPQADQLAEQLTGDLDRLRHLLPAAGPTRPVAGPVEATVADDHLTVAIPAGSRDLLTVEVATIDPDIQPVLVGPKPVAYGGMRLPTADQTTIGRQLMMRWLAAPHDTHRCVEVGLAADRLGAESLWTERMVAGTANIVPKLLAIVRTEASIRIHDPSIPRRLARQAYDGLADLERHLTERRHLAARR